MMRARTTLVLACLACAALVAGDALGAAAASAAAAAPGVDVARGRDATRGGDVAPDTNAVLGADASRDPLAGASSRLGALGSGGLDAGFARALEPVPLAFPEDHGPHPAFRHEWWYVTGNLDATSPSSGGAATRLGFELTIFRFALAPLAAATQERSVQARSHWRTRQIYFAHLAVTDVARGRFHVGERYSRDALGLAGAQAQPFRVWLGDWSIAEQAGGAWRLIAADGPYALDLMLDASRPPIANGDRGLSRKSDAPGAASYYYSIPRLAVSGTIARDGQPLAVRGSAWLDREWGSGALGPDQQGWDWFALQLDDGSALMFYALRRRDGTRDPHSAGTFVAADGTSRPLAEADVQIVPTATWDSPRGGRYPARWRVRVPSLRLDLDVKPVLADQELATNPRYWEGAVDVAGTRDGAAASGRGYVELVGYAR